MGVRQKQYLNVPVDFQIAHEYHRRSKVVLRMGGKSWPVTVKRTGRPATGIARAGGNRPRLLVLGRSMDDLRGAVGCTLASNRT